ncbi:MAG: hybrid sensor histidine kinase/response regulator, partial [Limnobacter sp.]|nr:hybrid sensor histidine kinase/response regulator [Limnobacter sp.]
MNAQVEFPAATDSGPELSVLSWCAGEIRQSLQAAGEALRRQLQAGPDDASALRAAGIALHQAHGALSVVGLSGVQVLTAEGERLLDAFGSGSVELTESRASAFERACTALAEYLDGLLAGDRHQPLYLFPYYRDLAFARGAERVSPSDLLALRPNGLPALDPARHSDASALAAARAAFERGLLRLLRNPEDRQALLAMHGAVDTVLHSPRGRAQAPFWQAALACFEAWRDGALSLDVNGKRLLARINLQIRH